MAEGGDFCTKLILMFFTGILSVAFGIQLILYFITDNPKPFSGNQQTVVFIILLMGLLLSAMAFWGALIENSCLCQISLVTFILLFISFVYQLIRCFLHGSDNCQTSEYIRRSLNVAIIGLLMIAILAFIQSIKDKD